MLISWISQLMDQSIKQRQQFSIAVSGGSTPLPFFKQAGELYRSNNDWRSFASQTKIFWVDERPVAIDHGDSNAGNAIGYFSETGVHLYPFKGDATDLFAEAERYQELISSVIPSNTAGIPCFDLLILGMGEDGHIASLFPESTGLAEKTKWVIPNYVSKLGQTRLTMTFPLLLAAQNIAVLYSGDKKKKLVEQVLSRKLQGLPIQMLLNQTRQDQVIFFQL